MKTNENIDWLDLETTPLAFICPVCNTLIWKDNDTGYHKDRDGNSAHVSHRGVDIGTCDGVLIRVAAAGIKEML